jgi:hypothetical protein
MSTEQPKGPVVMAGPTGLTAVITYDQARTVVEHALLRARSRDLPPMTVAVLDAAACLVAFARGDQSSHPNFLPRSRSQRRPAIIHAEISGAETGQNLTRRTGENGDEPGTG